MSVKASCAVATELPSVSSRSSPSWLISGASISGAIYGAIFIQFVPNIADQISKAAPWAIYGIFLIVFMYLMPVGVAGFIRIAGAWIKHRFRNRQTG